MCRTDHPELVRLDADLGSDKHDVIRALATWSATPAEPSDVDQLVEDALAREATSPTGLPGGIAIPHCRTTGVDEPTLAFARLAPTVDFGAKDGPADLAFLIAAPAGGDATHLQLLTKLARALVKPEFTDALRDGRDSRARSSTRCTTRSASPRRTPGSGGRGRRRGSAAASAPPRPTARLPPLPPPADGAGWSRSPPARPASPTPTWPPRRSRPRPSGPASTSRSRPRAPPASTPLAHDTIAQRGRGDLRRRRRRPRPGPVRRQAGGLLRREAARSTRPTP